MLLKILREKNSSCKKLFLEHNSIQFHQESANKNIGRARKVRWDSRDTKRVSWAVQGLGIIRSAEQCMDQDGVS